MLKFKKIVSLALCACVFGLASQSVHAATDNYTIELKAWIPGATIVDPIEALRAESFLNPTTKNFSSYFEGDNHRYYAGSYRTYAAVSFVWNGTDLSSVGTSTDIGATHLKYSYQQYYLYGFSPSGYPRCTKWSGCWYWIYGSEEDTASCCVVAAAVGRPYNTFGMSFNAGNPLVPGPGIDAILTGSIWDGNIQINVLTDKFPSYGLRIFRDGTLIADKMIFDAYNINHHDVLALTEGLLNFTNYKTYNISIPYPTDPPPPSDGDDGECFEFNGRILC